MKSKFFACIFIFGLLAGATTGWADQKVSFNDLPKPIQDNLNARPGVEVQDIDRVTRDGKVIYEIGFKQNGQHTELQYKEDGSLLTDNKSNLVTASPATQPPVAAAAQTQASSYGKVTLAQTPVAVQNTIKAQLGGAAVEDIDKLNKDGAIVYEVAFKRAGKHTELQIAENGTVVNNNIPAAVAGVTPSIAPPSYGKVTLNQVPVAVQNTIKAQTAGVEIEDIDKTSRDGIAVYEVAFKRSGQHTELVVAENGAVLSGGLGAAKNPSAVVSANPAASTTHVAFRNLPLPVQKTARALAGSSIIDQTSQLVTDGKVRYQVHFKRDGRDVGYLLNPNGAILHDGVAAANEVPVARNKPADTTTIPGGGRIVVPSATPANSWTKIAYNDLPPPVKTTARALAGSAPIEDVDRQSTRRGAVYQIAFKRDGQHQEYRIQEDGLILHDHVGVGAPGSGEAGAGAIPK
jgi:uncharacterized membrane protein YkoI